MQLRAAKTAFFIFTIALLAAPAMAADDKATSGDSAVLAIVNGEKLTKADLAEQMKTLPPQVQQLPVAAIYPQVLEQMIVERLIRKEGYAAKLDAAAEVRERVKLMEKKIVADEYLRREVKKRITDAQLMTKYNEYAKAFKATDEVRASHILVKTEAEANDVIKQVKGGADFAKLSSEKSLDKGAAAQGGDLGYFSAGQMVPEFEKAAFAMKAGDVSTKPVKTEFGYHVIKVMDKRKSQPDSFDNMKPELEAAASQEAAKDVVKELLQKATVERFDMDGKPLGQKAEIKN
jgi:peptidyl-prolyl cis-trans isomerase C